MKLNTKLPGLRFVCHWSLPLNSRTLFASRNCNFSAVGDIFAEQPYSVAVQQGSHLQVIWFRLTSTRLGDRKFFRLFAGWTFEEYSVTSKGTLFRRFDCQVLECIAEGLVRKERWLGGHHSGEPGWRLHSNVRRTRWVWNGSWSKKFWEPAGGCCLRPENSFRKCFVSIWLFSLGNVFLGSWKFYLQTPRRFLGNLKLFIYFQ